MDATPELTQRLIDGFDRLGGVLRSEAWASAEPKGLNPAQARVLRLLAARGPMRVKAIAAELGVSQPTASDSVTALERKGLVSRAPDPDDARAAEISLTPAGRALIAAPGPAASPARTALAALTLDEQTSLLLLITKLIRALQIAGAIPVQRMCVTCRHFRPHAHAGSAAPHHCAFVNAAFGDRDLRLDCGEHEAAGPAAEPALWAAFEAGPAAPLSPPPP